MNTAIGKPVWWKKGLIGIMALVTTGAVFFMLWRNGAFLPGWIRWESGVSVSAVTGSATGEYEISLKHRRVEVLRDGAEVWTSPKGVKVQKVLSCDIDRDREDELILLCWKIGRYGKYRPFWVEEDEKSWSQHIFVYEYNDGQIRPKWMSSYIGRPISDLAVCDSKVAGNRLLMIDLDGQTSSWIWDSWGFTRVDTDVSFIAFGDNLIHEPIYRYGLEQGSFAFLFEEVKDWIDESDVAVINQETPLVDDPRLYGDYPRFGTPLPVGEAIADAGFDVVSCATNHALDRGIYGIDTTKRFFESRKIKCLGIQTEGETEYQPCQFLVKKGIRFALLNYTYGTNGLKVPDENPYMVHLLQEEEQVRKDLAAAREEADFVILFVHWGTENSPEVDEAQARWTALFLAEKADVVIGTHPHTVQPDVLLEAEDGHTMLVYYSLGNFISAQEDAEALKGAAARFTVSMTPEGYRVSDHSLEPLVIIRQADGSYTVTPQESRKVANP